MLVFNFNNPDFLLKVIDCSYKKMNLKKTQNKNSFFDGKICDEFKEIFRKGNKK